MTENLHRSKVAYNELLSVADKVYGFICISSCLTILHAWYLGVCSYYGLIAILAFMFINLLLSQLTVKLANGTQHYVELARIFIVNGIILILVNKVMEGTFSPWWPGYLIVVTGSIVTMSMMELKKSLIIASIFYWSFHLFFSSWFFNGQNLNQNNLTYILIGIVSTGFIFLGFTNAYMKSVIKEHERSNELAEALKELRETKSHLVESNRLAALAEMAGGVAHEINNPLMIIKSYTEMINRINIEGAGNQDIIKISGLISQTVVRISKIVQSLLSFSKDSKNDPIEQVSISSLFDRVSYFCAEKFKNKGIDLRINEVNPSLVINCRSNQILQALLSLLNNSFDAIQSLPEKWINLEVKEREISIEIYVTDSGEGIPLEVREKIFNPFFTTKDVGKGTGLGLSVARGLLEAHGGTLYINEFSRNTSFIMSFPRPSTMN